MTAAIEAHDLTKRYGNGQQADAVHAVSLTIPRGELFGLFGSNGAGKTTLIRMLTTLLVPTGGQAWVNGFHVVNQASAVRASVGLTFSNEHSFYGRLSGRQNLNFFAALQNVPPRRVRGRVDQLLELFAMERYAGDMFQSYSTGMRQKLNVARALLHDPPIVFLDEPTKGMDVQTADTVRALLREEIVNRQGKTVFLTTHDLYKMEQLCDRIGVLAQGQIQALGKPRELLHQMPRESRYTIELDQPVAGLDSKLAQLEGIRQIQMQGVQIEFAADEAAFSERAVWETIYNAGGRIQRFGPQDEGLRTFLRRVGDDHANSHNAG